MSLIHKILRTSMLVGFCGAIYLGYYALEKDSANLRRREKRQVEVNNALRQIGRQHLGYVLNIPKNSSIGEEEIRRYIEFDEMYKK